MDNVYQHFRKDEAAFIDQAQSLIAQAAAEYRPLLTDFLDPRQQYITRVLAGSVDGVKVFAFGGYPHAERCRVILAPDYFTPQPQDYELSVLAINYPEKFATLHHSSILGTLANAGIQRDLFGDIITNGHAWQVVVAASMSQWVQANVTRLGKIGVRLVPVALDDILSPQNDWEPLATTLPSLRLDAVVAHVFTMSRQRAKGLVEGGKVRLNFAATTRPDVEVAAHDIVSVRGFGRLRLQSLLGKTKKDKLKVTVDVIHK
ncbi:RNA-binding protein [Lacticaseibacillus baoqingensis]|uniref:RNA-binding protein n=1 Tax=Lacticaseibacillus baoqingensis TaxID=2486013 RepID=A0ABW4E1C5_9LACO|nr:RNA-binding protein [Lacticaseibacillus baoqingensis]